ncbi:hypothetical protein BBP40_009983 [Aspergillus hancockii]|nr:hypothetical protein BBP40_009983 [Aspergillus hancockii]
MDPLPHRIVHEDDLILGYHENDTQHNFADDSEDDSEDGGFMHTDDENEKWENKSSSLITPLIDRSMDTDLGSVRAVRGSPDVAHALALQDVHKDPAIDHSMDQATQPPPPDDIESIYSDVLSVAGSQNDGYLRALVEELVQEIPLHATSSDITKQIYDVLPDLLKPFAFGVGHNTPSQLHRDVTVLTHKYRQDVVAMLREKLPEDLFA